MAFNITERMLAASLGNDIRPQLVMEIEGYPTLFSTTPIKRVIRYGDTDLEYGEGDVYGGFRPIEGQISAISFERGTSTSIRQTLKQDKGKGESISSMRIALVDLNGVITRDLLTPDETQTPTFDLLSRRVKIWYGFDDTAFKDDFIVIFRGVIQAADSFPGLIVLNINHPDDKKKGVVFPKSETNVLGNTGNFGTTDVNTSSETITAVAHGMVDSDPVTFESSDTLPAGLNDGFVVQSTANTFKVSNTVGGLPYDITSVGAGIHSFSGGIGASRTVINVDDTSEFLEPVVGPDGVTIDDDISFYIRINNEIIKYEAKSPTQFQTISRGQFTGFGAGVTTFHQAGDSVESIVVLQGNPMELAMKLMLSGRNGPSFEDEPITSFVAIGGIDTASNAIFFQNINVEQEYGITVGDYVTTTGATNGANNITAEEIVGITQNDFGSFITVDPATALVQETSTSAVIAIRSRFDSLGSGAKMYIDEVDVEQHEFVRRTFLASVENLFFIKEEINLKKFLSENLYSPIAAFSLPRQSKASVGYHLAGQLPTSKVKSLNIDNVTNPSELGIRRSISENFYNNIVIKYEEDILIDKFVKILVQSSSDSFDRIDTSNKALVLEAKGLREALTGKGVAERAAQRRLKKYQFGAEFIKNVKTNLKTGFDVEVGDTLLLSLADLQISDIDTGTRTESEPRIFEIVNKEFSLNRGKVTLSLVDSNFSRDIRYCLISPSSKIKTASSDTNFVIEASFNTDVYGVNEFRKWEEFDGAGTGTGLQIRSTDFVTDDPTKLQVVNGNSIQVTPAIASGTPSAGFIMESDEYDNATIEFNILYGFMTDNATFADGKPQYKML